MPLPVVCIIGRPNVGKSTLFNRILRRRQAVVAPKPGVTRDRHYAIAEWEDRHFALIDTGGLIMQTEEEMQKHITAQSELAINEADVVLFMLDGITGPEPDDRAIARLVLKSKKPTVVAVNKIDKPSQRNDIYEFTKLGPFELMATSAIGAESIGDLLDEVLKAIDRAGDFETDTTSGKDRPIHLALVGRPNVGKSSMANRLLGDDRMIVSNIPGTTRDSIDTPLTFEGQDYVLIDTAGLRKRKRVKEQVEFYTTLRSLRAIERADVVCVMLDATEELSTQDFKIAEAAIEAGKGLFFAVNKWDLIEKDEATAGTFVKELHRRVKTMSWAPIVFLSALTGQRATKLLEFARLIAAERLKHIPTQELNESVLADARSKPPPAVKGRFIKINYVSQGERPPPTFALFCNHPELIREPYERYLMNRLRERYGFEGVPLRIKFRKKNK